MNPKIFPQDIDEVKSVFNQITTSDEFISNFIKDIDGDGSECGWTYPLGCVWYQMLSIKEVAKSETDSATGKKKTWMEINQGSLFCFAEGHAPYHGVNKTNRIEAETIYIQCAGGCAPASWQSGKTYFRAKSKTKIDDSMVNIAEEAIQSPVVRSIWKHVGKNWTTTEEVDALISRFTTPGSAVNINTIKDSIFFGKKSDPAVRMPGRVLYRLFDNMDGWLIKNEYTYECTQDEFVNFMLTGDFKSHRQISHKTVTR